MLASCAGCVNAPASRAACDIRQVSMPNSDHYADQDLQEYHTCCDIGECDACHDIMHNVVGELVIPDLLKVDDAYVAEFVATIVRPQDQITGIEIDSVHGNAMQVCRVVPGLAADMYNCTVAPDLQLQRGDFILDVNFVSGDAKLMRDRLVHDKILRILVRRACAMKMSVAQTAASLRGGVSCTIMGLLVRDVPAEMLGHPSRSLRTNDRIISVNGISGDSDSMMDQVECSANVQLVVLRPGTVMRSVI